MNDKLVDWAIQKCVEVVILRAENAKLVVEVDRLSVENERLVDQWRFRVVASDDV